ncbi:MAG: type II toxin-antitoxin system Phd/YefM family antitoxin [Acidimicrobiia bacterium]
MERETIPISKFKATCLAVLEGVRTSGRSVVVTRRGEPVAEIVPPPQESTVRSWVGSAVATGRVVGDLVTPVAPEGEWEALGV